MKKHHFFHIVLALFFSISLNAEYIDTSKYQYDIDESISINVEELSSGSGYWLGIYPKSSGNHWTNVVSWPLESIKNGLVNVESINTAGTYEARLFYDDTYNLIDTVEFDVNSSSNDCGTPWYTASLTHYESYPTTDEEGNGYNGYEYIGQFKGVEGVKSENWVKEHKIVSVHEKDWHWLGNHELRIRQGSRVIVAEVLDICADSDTESGSACTDNLGDNDFLIDMEKYTKNHFGSGSGNVEFQVCY